MSSRTKDKFSELSQDILRCANSIFPRVEFVNKISSMLLAFSECDSVELWLKREQKLVRYKIARVPGHSFSYKRIPFSVDSDGRISCLAESTTITQRLLMDFLEGKFKKELPILTNDDVFWTGAFPKSLASLTSLNGADRYKAMAGDSGINSLAIIPLILGKECIGYLLLISELPDFFSESVIESYKELSNILAIALNNQRSQAALRERVKELTCLYEIARLSGNEELSFDELLISIARLLPPAWQFPEITVARIVLDGQVYSSMTFHQVCRKQVAEIIVKGEKRGVIEVGYTKVKPDLDEGPFLKEERNLINVIANQISLIVQRKEAELDRMILQEQLRHADRLATIGQLAAGVAHELNEPLGNILGFAQLIKKFPEIDPRILEDNDKIIGASLHAREIVKKLMLFAREMPPRGDPVNLNQVVSEGLFFFEARCAKAGIEVERDLDECLPSIRADQSQLNQVLVNLVVNSIQAMPDGGKLTLTTASNEDYVSLAVEDTGIGMTQEIKEKIFLPFFTTKDVDEGTGLGLAVVHGIVTSHKGQIEVTSTLGKGSKFKISFPVSKK